MSNWLTFSPRKQPPCRNCPDRILGCHGTCEKYVSWKHETDKTVEKRSTVLAKERDQDSQWFESFNKHVIKKQARRS